MLSVPLLLALALAGTPSAPAAPSRDAGVVQFRVDVPGVEVVVPVGDGRMVMNGLPMRIQAVKSRWNWLELQKYFQGQFAEAGFFIPPPRQVKPLKVPVVAAYDPKTQIFYTVIITPESDGKTTLILGESFVAEKQPTATADGVAAVPVHPSARQLVVADVEVARGASYFSAVSQAELATFYKEVLGRAGYEETAPLTFRKDSEQIRVHLSPREGDAGVAVSAMRTHVAD